MFKLNSLENKYISDTNKFCWEFIGLKNCSGSSHPTHLTVVTLWFQRCKPRKLYFISCHVWWEVVVPYVWFMFHFTQCIVEFSSFASISLIDSCILSYNSITYSLASLGIHIRKLCVCLMLIPTKLDYPFYGLMDWLVHSEETRVRNTSETKTLCSCRLLTFICLVSIFYLLSSTNHKLLGGGHNE